MDEIYLLRASIWESFGTVHAAGAGHRAEDVSAEIVLKVFNTGALSSAS